MSYETVNGGSEDTWIYVLQCHIRHHSVRDNLESHHSSELKDSVTTLPKVTEKCNLTGMINLLNVIFFSIINTIELI